MLPLVSIIIPTKNSASTIEDCILSLNNQEYPNIEILVIDNFSTDTTLSIAQKYADKTLSRGPERTQQKNYGISQAQGEYICFIDSDMVVTPGVISECIAKFYSTENIGGVCIKERSVGVGWFVRVRDFERSFYLGTSVESARFFRRLDVVKVGGFEEDLIFFEESLLPQKIENLLKLPCNISIESYIHHQEGNIQIIQWIKKKFYYGKSLAAYKEKVQKIGVSSTGAGQMGIVGRYMIFFKNKRFYSRPLLALSVVVLKTLEFSAGGVGFIYSKLIK